MSERNHPDRVGKAIDELLGSEEGPGPDASVPAEGPLLELEGYRAIRVLGSGGMGTVHLAWDETLDRHVAIKTIRTWTSDPRTEARFLREARAMARLDHPGVVRIHHYAVGREGPYLVMEYVEGESLAQRLRRTGALSWHETVRIIREVVSALEAAWSLGIVHRDVKPSNILLDRRGHVRVADFGLARPSQDHEITQTGMFQGSPYYISPEQAASDEIDWRSDVYSLGIVLYEMLTGRPPFEGTFVSVVSRHAMEELPEPSSIVDGVPAELSDLLRWMTAKQTADRPSSSEQILDAIDRITGEPTAPQPRWRRSRRLRQGLRSWLLLAALFGVASVGGLGWWQLGRGGGAAETGESIAPPAVVPGRRSVAVVGFRNLGPRPEDAWMSVAFSEILRAEITADRTLRSIPGGTVSRALIDLGVAGDPSPEEIPSIASRLAADVVVSGVYLAVPGRDELRIDLAAADRSGEVLGTLTEVGSVNELLHLLDRAGGHLRALVGGAPQVEDPAGRRVLPENPDSMRLYAEGLSLARTFRLVEARQALEAAVEAEPRHALSHAALAEVYADLGYEPEAARSARRAIELVGDLTPEERVWVEARESEISRRWDAAVRSYRGLLESDPTNVEYALRLVASLVSGGRAAEAEEVLAELRGFGLEDPRLSLAEAEAAIEVSDYHAALDAGTAAAERGREMGARLLVARAELHRGLALLRLGESAAGTDAFEESWRLFRDTGDRDGQARVLNRMAQVDYEQGRYREALATFEQALSIWRELGHLEGRAIGTNNVADTLMMLGQLGAARPIFEESLEITRQQGHEGDEGFMLVNLAELDLRLGRLALARQGVAAGRRLLDEAGSGYGRCMGHWVEGRIWLESGDPKKAQEVLESGARLAEEIGERRYLGYLLHELGEVSLARGEPDVAFRWFEEAREVRRALGSDSEVALSSVGAARALGTERWNVARIELERSTEVLSRVGRVGPAARALAIQLELALGAGDRPEAARIGPHLARVASVLEEVPTRLRCETALARTERDPGAALRRLDRVIEEATEAQLVLVGLEARVARAAVAPLVSDADALAQELEGKGLGRLLAQLQPPPTPVGELTP